MEVKMKKIMVFFLVLAFFDINFTLFAEEDDKQKLAVMEFEDQSGKLSQKMLSSATEYIRGAFVSTNKYVVIAKERQEKEMIKEMKKESYKACNDKNCQIPLGQALSADTILRTTITFFGGTYTITSELIDLEKEATIIGATQKFNGSEQKLMEALDKIVLQITGKEKPKNMSENSKDSKACEYARSDKSLETWNEYLESFPNGECAFEAKQQIRKLTKENGKKEQKTESKEKVQKIANLIWSQRYPKEMNWYEAQQYCENLSEGGFSDWRLPNIDELRSLIKDRKTVTGGVCKVSDKTACLAENCWSFETCGESCDRNWNCTGYTDGRYSKLVDGNVWLWSSSSRSDYQGHAWGVYFYNGLINVHNKSDYSSVRCVR